MTLSNPDVVRFLSEKVIPVWESLGPVPKVTIELGDGTVIQRTIGGNVVTYLTTPQGRVIDALPGVYTPDDYLAELQAAMKYVSAGPQAIRNWHTQKVKTASGKTDITLSKALVEGPLLNTMGLHFPDQPSGSLRDLSKSPATADDLAAELSLPGRSPPEKGDAAVAMDSLRNREVVRPAVHRLLAGYELPPLPNDIRDAIYKQILHVAIDQPDLGLRRVLVPGTQ